MLQLTIKPSRQLANLLLFIHSLALLASTMNSLPIGLKCLLIVVISGHFYVNRAKTVCCRIAYSETGWKIAQNEEFISVEILPSSVLSCVAIFLHIKGEKIANHSLVIFHDALAKEDYRALLVNLKTTLAKSR